MDISEWQTALYGHFTNLHQVKRSGSDGALIFALEHGLDADALQDLKVAIRSEIGHGRPRDSYWLPWVIYAAELGYQYAGEEYWQTFEKETPGWCVFNDRYWLRGCYRKFSNAFSGVVPKGIWANQFSIICWPITHALLPTDLQRQLAKLLYDLRDRIRYDHLTSPEFFGKLIANNSWRTTSRFQMLTDQPLLLGNIATALLLHGHQDTNSPILTSTLSRIVANVERERAAREWLRDAQTAAGGVRTRGLQATQISAREGNHERKKRADDELRGRFGIELSLLLHRQADGTWKACIEVPDLSPIIIASPQIEQALSSSRCIISTGSTTSTVRPGKWLLGGPRQVVLSEWPVPDKPLIKLEHASQEASALIEALFYLHPKRSWLFHIIDNNIAREVKSNRVKPGWKYLLISTSSIKLPSSFATPVPISCKGVSAVFLELPVIVPKHAEQVMNDIGLAIIKGFSIWPVGISPARWDGDGQVEWLINPDYARRA